jgi:hypothetical protein
MERDLPIGVAPNVHVSLVLLPEECRWLTDRPGRFWRKELKLRAMSRLFGWRFERQVRKALAARPSPPPEVLAVG